MSSIVYKFFISDKTLDEWRTRNNEWADLSPFLFFGEASDNKAILTEEYLVPFDIVKDCAHQAGMYFDYNDIDIINEITSIPLALIEFPHNYDNTTCKYKFDVEDTDGGVILTVIPR